MRASRLPLVTFVTLGLAAAAATVAEAKCTRLAFSVNDYGKDGPTRDAKNLLDKYIAKWAADNGIKSYTTGKKDVSCELFLDFGVFDEWTCKAAATVCWPDGTGPANPSTPVEASAKRGEAKKKAADAPAGEPKAAAPKAAAAKPEAEKAEPRKAATPAGEAQKAAAPKAPAPVTTGSVPAPPPAQSDKKE